ncbi:MAG TPA: DUF2911 domain-containing protein [Longimicrobium sp.]|nr:DUF2911 domain-containing protein [Longimicrobium sp.]
MGRISIVRTTAVAAALAAATTTAAEAQVRTRPPAAPATAQQGRVLSPRDTSRLDLGGGKRMYVDYGRPSMRGRRIVGGLVPLGRVWRTGANAATTLVTEGDLTVGTASVPRGTYTLYTLPTATGWTLIVNRQTGQWGTEYDPSRDLVRIPMQTTTLRQPVEQFTLALERGRAGTHALVLSWENTRASVPIRVGAPARRSR